MNARGAWRRLVARARTRLRGDRGSISVELALGYTPVMVLVLLGLFAVVRIVSAQIDVNAASSAAARQASLAFTPGGARTGAEQAAAASLTGRTLTCQPRSVAVDTGTMAPGTPVTVRLACTVSLQDLFGLGLPGSMTISGDATQVLDSFRSQP